VGPHRILLVVDQRCAPAAIGRDVAGRAGGWPSEVYVVAAPSGSGLDRLLGDEAVYASVTQHLDATVDELAAIRNLDVKQGRIGSHDPIHAADTSLREFAADEIVFAVAVDDNGRPAKARMVEIAPSRYEIPVTIAQLPRSSRPASRG
jgi:hypothetical protein